MALSKEEADEFEALEAQAIDRLGKIDPGSEEYDLLSGSLDSTSGALDTYYRSLRKVDDGGKLTNQPATRQPATVGESDGDYEWYFEPNRREVQAFFRNNPDVLDRLKLRTWAETPRTEAIRSPVIDNNTVIGYNITPAQTNLDLLQEDASDPESPYAKAAEEMYRLKREEAERSGKSLKRYRDVKLTDNPFDYLKGGWEKGINRIATPAVLGAADAMTAGQASPGYDALRDLAIYRQSRLTPEEKESARAWGYDPEDADGMSSAEEITNRSMPAYVAGNIGGYGLPGNPANAIQNAATRALGYGGKGFMGGVIGRALGAAAGGAVSGAEESALRDMARYANEGEPIPLGNVAVNAGFNAGMNFVTGGAFDLLGQGIGSVRQAYRRSERMAPMRAFEQAGGEAAGFTGVRPTKEMRVAEAQAARDELDETKAPYTPAGKLASELAPQLEYSVKNRAVRKQEEIRRQMEEYYAHPAYNEKTVSTKPAIEGMVEMAQRSMTRRQSGTGERVAMYPARLKEIGGILRNYSRVESVRKAEAEGLANTVGGVVIDGELSNNIYGFKEGDEGWVRPGDDAIVLPIEITAENLTTLEQRIDDELFRGTTKKKDDPVWDRFNERVKGMRDNFRLYRDAEGNLVPPPEAGSSQPFDLADDVPRAPGRGTYLAPPTAVGEPTKPPNIDEPGIGPGQGPFLPKDPFDAREGSRELNGVVAGKRNPFDTVLPTSEEAVRPLANIEVKGGEYGPPPPLDPNARMGVGDRFNPEPVQGFTEEGLPIPRVSKQPTKQVQGSYNKPPEVQMEPAPKTDRNPYGFADRGQPPPEQPLPPSERRRTNKEPELQVENANDLKKIPGALVVPKPLLKDQLSKLGIEPTRTPGQAREMRIEQEMRSARDQGFDSVEDYNEFWEANHATSDNPNRETIEGFIARKRAERGQRIEPRADQDITREVPASPEQLLKEFPSNQRVQLAEVRAKLKGMSRAEQDELLKRMQDNDELVLYRNDNPMSISKADKEAAMDINGNPRHLVYFTPKAADKRGGLERMLDDQLQKAPKVPTKEIDEIGAAQTADLEQVARNRKAYVEDLFAPGREARAAQVEKLGAIAENPDIVNEVLEQVKDIERRLGDGQLSVEQKREMVASALKQRGINVDIEDLVRFGLISAGLVTLSKNDSESDTRQAGFSLGSLLVALGLRGKGKGAADAEPTKPAGPTEPEFTIEVGGKPKVLKGFSAMRAQQHDDQVAIEKALKALGVEGTTTLENRIRTYGQLEDRGAVDQALLDEANRIGKGKELRTAAGTNAWRTLHDRAWFGGNEGWVNKFADVLGFRIYRGLEHLSGRHTRDTPPGDDGLYRNPYVREPTTVLGQIQREMLENPLRRITDLTRGGPASRLTGNAFLDAIRNNRTQYMSVDEDENRKKQQASP